MNVLSLCSGIGGLDLGLERAGMTVVGQVEIDPFCQRVLARHWPEVPHHDDVHTWWNRQSRPAVELLAAGFSCQPHSHAGLRLGTDDERWLWPAIAHAIGAIRPGWVVLENVPGLRTSGLNVVLADLARHGYRAATGTITACTVGAPHPRERLFVLAHADGIHGETRLGTRNWRPVLADDRGGSPWTDPIHGLVEADTRGRRMADGVPRRLDGRRIRGLGNAVVPQIGQRIGQLVMGSIR